MALEPDNPSGGGEKERPKRGGLSGLFGFRSTAVDAEDLPAMDVAAGLDRALRRTGVREAPQQAAPNFDNNIRDALLAIESALYSIDRVREIIEQAYEVALSAHEAEEAGARALLAESFDELRLQINSTVEGIEDRAATLIGKNPKQIDVKLGGKAHYSVSPFRLDVSSKGLSITPPRDAFETYDEINAALDELDVALKRADRAAAAYCRDAQFLIARLNNDEAAA